MAFLKSSRPNATSPARKTLRQIYEQRCLDGDLRADSSQDQAVELLDRYASAVQGYHPNNGTIKGVLRSLGWVGKTPFTVGLYIYGDVGRGKSMLMDLFCDNVDIKRKRRVHFHQFMLEIHDRLHRLNQTHQSDVMDRLASDLAAETWLLCFDEFHVSNIADAMILGRLFEALFAAGVLIVATSNWPPDMLYKNGLQRDRFLPFIDMIKNRMTVYSLNGAVDHRYEQLRGIEAYFSPLGSESTRRLQGIFIQLTDDARPEKIKLPVQGRMLTITHAARGVGFFNFDELCGNALGASDYLEIATCLHTVILDGVPVMREEKRNETIRFITLIDALYEAKVKFFMAAADVPEKLAPLGEYAFAFQRTLSRLAEMQSETYRKKTHLAA